MDLFSWISSWASILSFLYTLWPIFGHEKLSKYITVILFAITIVLYFFNPFGFNKIPSTNNMLESPQHNQVIKDSSKTDTINNNNNIRGNNNVIGNNNRY